MHQSIQVLQGLQPGVFQWLETESRGVTESVETDAPMNGEECED